MSDERGMRMGAMKYSKIFGICVALGAVLSAAAARGAEFMVLGKLRPTDESSDAYAVSADGSTVVGVSFNNTAGYEAVRWTIPGGIQTLGAGQPSEAYGVSADGSVIVGRRPIPGSTEAFRWTSAAGLVGLGDIPGGLFASGGRDVSADGTVITGYGYSDNLGEASIWTAATGMAGLGRAPGDDFGNSAVGITGNGSVVVGNIIRSAPPGLDREAFRWTDATGIVPLGDFPGGQLNSEAFDVSADGSVVVGRSTIEPIGFIAFRWTEATGMVALPPVSDGTPFRLAAGVSGDGNVIVGAGAIVWDEFHGSRILNDIVVEQGVDLDGWSLGVARAASFDGLTIVGAAFKPEVGSQAFIVRLDPGTFIPEPSALLLVTVSGVAVLFIRRRLRDRSA